MVDVFSTIIIGFVILSVVLISVGAAMWGWGELIAPTFTTIANSSIMDNSSVDVNEVISRADTGLYLIGALIIVGVFALIIIALHFERERYAYGGG